MTKDERVELSLKRKEQLVKMLHKFTAEADGFGFTIAVGLVCNDTGAFSTEMKGMTISMVGITRTMALDVEEYQRRSAALEL